MNTQLDDSGRCITEQHGLTSQPKGEASPSLSSSQGGATPPVAKMLVRVIMCEVVKPIEGTRDELGELLRGLADQTWRATNAAIDAHRNNGDAWREAGLKVQSVAETQRTVLDNLRAWYASRKDGTDRDRARNAFRAQLYPSSAVLDACQSRASVLVGLWRKGAPRGETTMPSMKRGRSIPVRDGKWRVRRDEKGYVVEMNLLSSPDGKKRVPWTAVAVVACGGSAHAMLRRLLDGELRPCDMRLVWDDRKSKWYAKLVTKGPAPEPLALSLDRPLAVHWGVREALTWADVDGRGGSVKAADGAQLLAFKARCAARRSQLRGHQAALGSGAIGHGKRRRERGINKLLNADERFTKSWCERAASGVVKMAIERGCGVLLVEDYSPRELADDVQREDERLARLLRRLPNAQLREAIHNAAMGAGLVVREVPSVYESVTCPVCRHVDATQDDGRGTFTCKGKCVGYKRPVDLIAALNMLAAAGASDAGRAQAAHRREVGKTWQENAGEKGGARKAKGNSSRRMKNGETGGNG